MRSMKMVMALAALSTMTISASASVSGQAQNALTQKQRADLYGTGSVRPGIYQIRALHSGHCIALRHLTDALNQPYLMQYECRDQQEGTMPSHAVILPHPLTGNTVRFEQKLYGGRATVAGQVGNCATVARGVVIGPARIDVKSCELPSGSGDWTMTGTEDQRFLFNATAPDTYRIMLATADDLPQCWSVRGGGMNIGDDVIKWECNGNGDQSFQLIWKGPLTDSTETMLLQKLGWQMAADGHRRNVTARGVSLSGDDYFSFETIEDEGKYCASRCLSEVSCKAWTWKGTGFDSPKPMCHLKSAPGAAANRGPGSFGRVASGIPRP